MARLDKLLELEEKLFAALQECKHKELAAIARQYRETIHEIEEIEGAGNDGDEIAQIIQKRGDDGKPGAVRKNRAAI